jgi:hypothetical protein
VSLAPVPSEQAGGGASCANCSAPLAPDQRYCLACGQPSSPVRLAFLDVLQAEAQPYAAGGQSPVVGALPPGYAPVIEPVSGASAWMRRYSGLFGLLSVLLLAIVVGLLVGHWVTQSKAPSGSQVIKVEGLSSAPAASSAASTTPTTAATTPAASKSSASAKSEEEKELAAAKAEEKAEEKTPAKAPEAKKISSTAVTKLESSTGKTHEKELNKISTAPIEVK